MTKPRTLDGQIDWLAVNTGVPRETIAREMDSLYRLHTHGVAWEKLAEVLGRGDSFAELRRVADKFDADAVAFDNSPRGAQWRDQRYALKPGMTKPIGRAFIMGEFGW